MKIVIGETAETLQIFDNEGRDISETLSIKSVAMQTAPGMPTVVRLDVYAHEIEIETSEPMIVKVE